MAETVYRVQDKDGRGPWKPGFSQMWIEERADHDNLPPWFLQFGRVERFAIAGMYVGCGCRTVEQLKRWFLPSEFETLKRHGYRAVKLKVGRILAASDIQCVFECAKPLQKIAEPFELYAHNGPLEPRAASARRTQSGG